MESPPFAPPPTALTSASTGRPQPPVDELHGCDSEGSPTGGERQRIVGGPRHAAPERCSGPSRRASSERRRARRETLWALRERSSSSPRDRSVMTDEKADLIPYLCCKD